MVKLRDYMITDKEFFDQVCHIETGIISMMVRDYADRIYGVSSEPKRLFVEYPFEMSYTAMSIDFYDDNCFDRYNDFCNSYSHKIDGDMELPVYTQHNTFNAFMSSRLKNFLDSSVDVNDPILDKEYDTLFLNQERNRIFRFDCSTDRLCAIKRTDSFCQLYYAHNYAHNRTNDVFDLILLGDISSDDDKSRFYAKFDEIGIKLSIAEDDVDWYTVNDGDDEVPNESPIEIYNVILEDFPDTLIKLWNWIDY